MLDIAVIYPNQLFEKLPYRISDMDIIIITEDCLFFDDPERKLKFNLLKLIYQRACMRYYFDHLSGKHKSVKYLDYVKKKDHLFQYINNKHDECNLHIIDPTDHLLQSRIEKYSKKYNHNLVFYHTPMFLLTTDELEEYDSIQKKKKYYQYNFYIWHRKRTGILMKDDKPIGGKYSYDKYNRKKIANNVDVPDMEKYDNDYYEEAIEYCENTFTNYYKENYEPNNIYFYPVTHRDAKKHFKRFIDERLQSFGDYQDAMNMSYPYLFHSVISPQLNIGLITPDQLIARVLKKKADLASTEGFIRQLNWREYSRYLYLYGEDMKQNYFNNNKILNRAWYTGETTIAPVDATIQMAFRYGYLHHILRLMVMCNFMNLCQINPDSVYEWFMEFSLDSYDWVMVNNVYSMGMYADGGLTMTKPYISSDNYLTKMGMKCQDDEWKEYWKVLYYYFIYRNYDKLTGRAAIYRHQWNNLNAKKKVLVKKIAKKFLNNI